MNYNDIANKLRIQVCEGPCEWGDNYRHEKGGAHGGSVHWKRERITRVGIYEFLKLVSMVEHNVRDLPPYEQIWVHSTYATNTAKGMGIVIPSLVTKYDRLRVRSLLPPEIPSNNVIYKWTHKETV